MEFNILEKSDLINIQVNKILEKHLRKFHFIWDIFINLTNITKNRDLNKLLF